MNTSESVAKIRKKPISERTEEEWEILQCDDRRKAANYAQLAKDLAGPDGSFGRQVGNSGGLLGTQGVIPGQERVNGAEAEVTSNGWAGVVNPGPNEGGDEDLYESEEALNIRTKAAAEAAAKDLTTPTTSGQPAAATPVVDHV